jgi:hypothetical protein
MNLIMSEVEETIMLVDAESVANGQGVVNVCHSFRYLFVTLITQRTGRKTENGDVVCKRRWCYPCKFVVSILFKFY